MIEREKNRNQNQIGPYAELGRPYTWLYGTWLAQSGEEAADAPCVEEYLNDARTSHPPSSEPRSGCRSAEPGAARHQER